MQMQIGLIGYFDAVVVEVKEKLLLFRLDLAILCYSSTIIKRGNLDNAMQ